MTVKHPNAYVYQKAFTLPVDVDSYVFCTAWDATVTANAILRTRLIQTGSGVFQAVVRGSIEWGMATSIEDYLADNTHGRMDLGVPLLQLALVRQAKMPLIFVLTIHHAPYDGFSLPLTFLQVQRSCGRRTPAVSIQSFHSVSLTARQEARERLLCISIRKLECAYIPCLALSNLYTRYNNVLHAIIHTSLQGRS